MDTPAKVLLVDDEPGVRESVQAYLQYGDDFEVRTASNANEAWDLLNQEIPELVISDIMMPQVDGYQFLKKLREDARFQTIPVVFLLGRVVGGGRRARAARQGGGAGGERAGGGGEEAAAFHQGSGAVGWSCGAGALAAGGAGRIHSRCSSAAAASLSAQGSAQ